MGLRAGIYLRVSTDKQDAENQRAQLEALCSARGWTIYKVYEDVIGGGEPGKAAFNDLMHDARTGKVQVVAFVAWDRITRSGISATFRIMELWQHWNVAWESIHEGFLSTTDPAIAQLLLAIIAWKNEQEKLIISSRTKAGLARRKALGVRLGRPKGIVETKPRRKRKGPFDDAQAGWYG